MHNEQDGQNNADSFLGGGGGGGGSDDMIEVILQAPKIRKVVFHIRTTDGYGTNQKANKWFGFNNNY